MLLHLLELGEQVDEVVFCDTYKEFPQMYEHIEKIRKIARDEVDVVASGGAGTMEHFAEAAEAGATVLLAASVFHFKVIEISELKKFLAGRGFEVR